MPVCCSPSISIRFEYLSVSSSVAVRVQYVLDLRCGLSKLHSTIMVSVFPCLSLPRPPRHDERGAKLKYSLNTFIRHNKLHQLLSSRTELFHQQLHSLPIWTKISVIWGTWDVVQAKTYLAPWTTGVTVGLLVIDNPVWHCPTDSKLYYNIFRIEIKILHYYHRNLVS